MIDLLSGHLFIKTPATMHESWLVPLCDVVSIDSEATRDLNCRV